MEWITISLAIAWFNSISIAPPPKPAAGHLTPDYGFAAVLLTQPPKSPVPVLAAGQYPIIREGLIKVGTNWEIISTYETQYMLKNPDYFEDELNELRARYEELKDVPPAGDANRLPPRDWLSQQVQFNSRLQQHLAERLELELDRPFILQAAIDDLKHCHRIYSTAVNITYDFSSPYHKRKKMAELIKLIGRDAYDRMDLGDVVPDWIFSDLKK